MRCQKLATSRGLSLQARAQEANTTMDIKKIIAKLPTGFLDEVAGMDGDQLRAEIIKAETSIREVEMSQKADEKLTGAREIVKDIVGGYNDARKAQRAKIAYTLHVLEERGELGVGEHGSDAVTGSKPGPARSKKTDNKKRSAA
jgi:hypothetical protein